jgi:Collagen triple helix repeat (20 copies)
MRSLCTQFYLGTAMVLLACLSALPASAAITIQNAFIDQGSLRVSGTSSQGTTIELDALFSAPIAADKFKFAINNYHPGDCIISLKTNIASDPAVNAVVSYCGLRGLTHRGDWLASNSYKIDDAVTHNGSSWRAKEAVAANSNHEPSLDGAVYWEKFVARGDDDIMGSTGSRGDKGDNGETGLKGDKGDAGLRGPKSDKGETGLKGDKGDTGADGPQGRKRDKDLPSISVWPRGSLL